MKVIFPFPLMDYLFNNNQKFKKSQQYETETK